MTDIIVTLAAYALTVGAVLLWIFLSKQDRVPRTLRMAVGTCLRTLPLFVALYLICRSLHVEVFLAVLVLGFALLGCLTSPLGDPTWVFAILYLFQQWILGWPDRADTLLEPPAPREIPAAELDALIGRTGVASSALRPGGTITLDGTEYLAHSDLGYLDGGRLVRVVGRKGTSLIVRDADES